MNNDDVGVIVGFRLWLRPAVWSSLNVLDLDCRVDCKAWFLVWSCWRGFLVDGPHGIYHSTIPPIRQTFHVIRTRHKGPSFKTQICRVSVASYADIRNMRQKVLTKLIVFRNKGPWSTSRCHWAVFARGPLVRYRRFVIGCLDLLMFGSLGIDLATGNASSSGVSRDESWMNFVWRRLGSTM